MITSRELNIIITECFDPVLDPVSLKAIGDIPLDTLQAGLEEDATQPTRHFPDVNTPRDLAEQYKNNININVFLDYRSLEYMMFSAKNTGLAQRSRLRIYHEGKLQTILDQHQATLLIYGWPLTAKEFYDDVSSRLGEGKIRQLIGNCYDNKEYPLLEAENFESPEALKEHVLRELFDTGRNKAIGKIPWESLEYLNVDVDDICRQLAEQGLQTKIYDANSSFTKRGMLYVWDECSLNIFIEENKTVFQRYNIPTGNLEQFIDTIAIEQFGRRHELMDLLNKEFRHQIEAGDNFRLCP